LEDKYFNIYYRKDEAKRGSSPTDFPGWWSTPATKLSLLSDYLSLLSTEKYYERSNQALNDSMEYIFFEDGTVEHRGSKDRIDPSGARDGHGDRTIASALSCKILIASGSNLLHNGKSEEEVARAKTPPPGSFGDRLRKRQEEEEEFGGGWNN
jgi:hypothetical protein